MTESCIAAATDWQAFLIGLAAALAFPAIGLGVGFLIPLRWLGHE
jgi:predicted Na+-dependent transporter